MPGTAPPPEGGARPTARGDTEVRVAFVNNMPDGAFRATERQFLGLLDAGSAPLSVEVCRYALPGVPRGARVAERIAEEYLPLDELWGSRPDAVIVTGSEPLAPTLREEPYWDDLARVLGTFTGQAGGVLLSCLSAHVALELFDGIVREPLAAKCTGVFPEQVSGDHPLTEGLPEPLVLPHSRLNHVPERAVREAGYEVLLRSEAAGWSIAAKEEGPTLLLLVQGHPEYEPSSLLREYHRDVDRYVSGARSEPPRLPAGCVAEGDREALERLQCRLQAGERDPALAAGFPFEEAARRADWPWRSLATRLFASWLAETHTRSR